jgi:hypothetical protein
MYVMPLGPAASLVGVWHRGQRAATSSAMVGESCVPPQVPGEADAQRVWLSDAAAKLVAVCPWSDQWSLMIFDDLWWSLTPLMRLTSGVFWGDITRLAPRSSDWLWRLLEKRSACRWHVLPSASKNASSDALRDWIIWVRTSNLGEVCTKGSKSFS